MKFKNGIFLLVIFCIAVTALAVYILGGIDTAKLEVLLNQLGIWAPIIYIVLYTVATLLVLPSTALNLTSGAIFGIWLGTLWTSIAAIIAAIVAFAFTRTVGREMVASNLAGRWQAIDAEMSQGGLFYVFAIRLLPLIPYGLVNFAAGLTSIRFRDYFLGTILGTVPGVLPFVMLGSSGLQAIKTGKYLPLMGSLGLAGLLVGGATWYRRRRQFPGKKLQEKQKEKN